MKKFVILISFLFIILFASCDGIYQRVEYRFDSYEIQTWNNYHHYNSIIYTDSMKYLESIKKSELKKSEKSIIELKKLNNWWN